ncbi:MAG: 5'-methylthioadenosine/adenosylhomocysteine nucleosidase [Ruminococcus sp.]
MIGIICALKIEVEGIHNMMSNPQTTQYARMSFIKGAIKGKEVVAVECGIGKVNAAVCAQAMIDLFKPDLIINSGIAGSLSEDLSIGDIVVAKDVVQHDMDGTEMGDPPGEIWFNDEKRIEIPADSRVSKALENACLKLENTKTLVGRIATGDTFVASVDRRLAIADKFNADACEMEGGAIGQVCYRNGVPFAILRSISDDINQNEFMDFEKFRKLASEKSIRAISYFIEDFDC